MKPQLRCVSNGKATTNNQWNSCGHAQDKESSPGPTARKHRKQSLQVFPLLRRDFALVRGECNGIGGPCESPNVRDALDSFGWLMRIYNSMIPRFKAAVTAWVRSLTPSLERMLLTWPLTVSSEIAS